jgi:eukaryotic-like serine/threonine-protein kinase
MLAHRRRMVAVALHEEAVTVAEDEATIPKSRSRRASAPLVTGERYELGATIGRGGMGEILAAYDSQIGRDVAIKRMTAAKPTLAQLARFLREARIQGRLEHPAIPPVHEVAVDGQGRPFFVMKKLVGVTLAEVLRDPAKHASFTRRELLRAFVEVCRAIELAHAHHIVHRDIKPSNVLLGDHEVYVLDWGIARELGTPEPPDGVLGTRGYMAPEQRSADPNVDARADIYSLGCVLHEILSGQQLNPTRPPTAPPRDDMPPELAVAVSRATSPSRDDRMTSARELADTVQRYLDGDRDVTYRNELARAHLEAAQAALLADTDEETRRRTAMREAGRALALDPTLTGAAELVGRLMLTPPRETPKEVVAEVAAIDEATDRRQLRMVASVSTFYLASIPLLWFLGIHDVPYLAAFAAVSLLNTGGQIGAFYSERFRRLGWPLALLTGVALTALVARMWTPFLLAPSIVVVSLMSFAMSSMARRRFVIVTCATLSILTVIAVYAAEAIGWLSPTTIITADSIILRSPLDGAESFPCIPGLIFFFISIVISAASVSHAVSREQHRAREQLQVQSWHLRQLL